jgi:hypothetical protein
MRKFGDILLDMEVLLDEMIDEHDVQLGDILNLIHGHIQIHRQDCIEIYEEDDSSPIFAYKAKE